MMRLFTVVMLIMVSMGAEADVKILYGEKGTEKFEGTGGTIEVKQEESKDDKTKVTVTLIVTPDNGYTMAKDGIELYATAPANVGGTRAPEVSGDPLKLDCADFKDISQKRTYTVDIDSKLALWVKNSNFQLKKRENGAKNGTGPVNGDFSGYYYIENKGKKETANAQYYLCPSTPPNNPVENYNYSAIYYDGNNKQQPFITTSNTNQGDNSVWRVKYATTANNIDYYYIIHYPDEGFLTHNNPLDNSNDANKSRLRVHLQSNADGDNSLFKISSKTEGNISPKSQASESYRFLNPANGNKNSLQGINTSSISLDGNTVNTGGMIGLYNSDSDTGSKWDFVVCTGITADPIITNNYTASNTFTITATEGATIYYTTDGSTPTTSTTTTGTTSVNITQTENITVIKAIAKTTDDKPSMVTTYVLERCEKPEISVSGTTATLTCTTPNASFYWTNDPDETPQTSCTSPFDIGNNSVIKVIAKSPGYKDSYPAYYAQQVTVHSTDEMNLIGNFLLADDFVVKRTLGSELNPFVGTIDGQYHTIKGLTHALVAYANGATIKNVVLDEVNISNGTNVGAICNEADGDTKIYNCGILSGSVSGSGNVGGLVGLIKSESSVKVVNCYNFASVSGSTMAGVVGKNEGTVGDVRIAMCMMYGDMPGGTSPVYSGNHVSNASNFTEYNFYRSKANLSYSVYNDQLAIDKDENLTRFPFYRHILNTHRELASYFLFGDYSEEHINEIGHWVLKKGEGAPLYPVVETWEKNTQKTPTDNNNNLPNTTADYEGKLLTSMGTSGYLSVTVKIGTDGISGNSAIKETINLPITDMDVARYDYTYGKVILPYANEIGTWTPNYDKICTGWKITEVDDQTSYAATNYNFADRTNKQKDIYHATNNPYIFAQGGYYIVPKGVTAITIEANFANAYYLSDATYDVGYNADYTVPTGLGGSTNGTFHGKTVYNNVVSALEAMSSASTPHTQAIVLVGNYHFPTETPTGSQPYNNNPISGYTSKAFTLMSIDEDNNQEPDYAWYSNGTFNRPAIAPVRFDFVALIPVGMSSHVDGSKGYPGIPVWKPRGWFEITETGLSIMNQFELDSGFFTTASSINNRCVINGGYFTQMVRAQGKACDRVSYYKIGGNAYIKEFYPGNHSAKNYDVKLVPINVTGGEIEQCFMTGFGKGKATGSDIYFWCAGGKIHKFLGAYMENPSTANVNMTANIDHALIGRFFGGGTSAKANIKGTIDVTISNSKVDFYCGGPEFSSADYSPTVKTTADNTVFGEFYGAGYGGTSITYSGDTDDDNVPFTNKITSFPSSPFNDFYVNNSNAAGKYGRLRTYPGFGIGTCYNFEFINHSFHPRGVARFYTGYAQFSLATTGSVTNLLTNCKIKRLLASETIINQETSGDFYGAGCQGMVSGEVTSTLKGCEVAGSAFGGGYKATSNKVKVFSTDPPTYSEYDRETGIFSDFGEGGYDTFTWEQGYDNDPDDDNPDHDGVAGTGEETGKLFTSKDVQLNDLGNVTGAISLTIDGGFVGGALDGETPAVPAADPKDAIPAGGSVYGGGNESKSLSDTSVTLTGNAVVYGDVFGGGNKAEVSGSATVNIKD